MGTVQFSRFGDPSVLTVTEVAKAAPSLAKL